MKRKANLSIGTMFTCMGNKTILIVSPCECTQVGMILWFSYHYVLYVEIFYLHKYKCFYISHKHDIYERISGKQMFPV